MALPRPLALTSERFIVAQSKLARLKPHTASLLLPENNRRGSSVGSDIMGLSAIRQLNALRQGGARRYNLLHRDWSRRVPHEVGPHAEGYAVRSAKGILGAYPRRNLERGINPCRILV